MEETRTVSGRDLPELFRNAGLELAGLLVDPSTAAPGGIRDRLRADGPDLSALLLAWLREVLFQFNVNGLVPAEIILRRLEAPPGGACVLEAEVDGELLDPGRHVLRRAPGPASFRDVCVEKTPSGWTASFRF